MAAKAEGLIAMSSNSIRDIGRMNRWRKKYKPAKDLLIILQSDNEVIADPDIIQDDGLVYSQEYKKAFMHLDAIPHYRWADPYEDPYEEESRLIVASEPVDPDFNSEFVNRVLPAATRKTTAGRKSAIEAKDTPEGWIAKFLVITLCAILAVQVGFGFWLRANAPPPTDASAAPPAAPANLEVAPSAQDGETDPAENEGFIRVDPELESEPLLPEIIPLGPATVEEDTDVAADDSGAPDAGAPAAEGSAQEAQP